MLNIIVSVTSRTEALCSRAFPVLLVAGVVLLPPFLRGGLPNYNHCLFRGGPRGKDRDKRINFSPRSLECFHSPSHPPWKLKRCIAERLMENMLFPAVCGAAGGMWNAVEEETG